MNFITNLFKLQEKYNMEDPRKTGLKNGLRQLSAKQLQRVIDYPSEMVLDSVNYENGNYCPLAIGAGLDLEGYTSHIEVFSRLEELGFTIFNTRGIVGEFYTSDRYNDLILAAKEVLAEKLLDEA